MTEIAYRLASRSVRRLVGPGPVILSLVLAMASAFAPAQAFPLFGARNWGMGLAGVASVNDLSAVYVNPAALAREDRYRLTLPDLGIAAFSPIDVKDTMDIIDDLTQLDLTSPGAPQQAVDLINQLDDDIALGMDAHGLIAFDLPLNLTFSFTERGILNLRVVVDTVNISTNPLSPNWVGDNQSSGIGDLVWLQQAGLSWATPLPFLSENILVGATGIVGHATTYFVAETLYDLAGGQDEIDWLDRIKDSDETTVFADLVLGAQAHLFDRRLVVGITANHLLAPTLDRDNGTDFTLDPQVRIGIAYSPFYRKHDAPPKTEAGPEDQGEKPERPDETPSVTNPLTFTLDFDITENESTLPVGIDSQQLGGGVEWGAASWVALRGGAYTNLSEEDLGVTFTLGAQLAWLSLAVGWSSKSEGDYPNDLRAALSLDVTF